MSSSVLSFKMRQLFLVHLQGFRDVTVVRFSPGSVVAEIQVVLDPNSQSRGDDVLQAMQMINSGSSFTVDLNTIEIITGIEICLNVFIRIVYRCRYLD